MSEAKFLSPTADAPKKSSLADASLVSDKDKGGARDKAWAAAVSNSHEDRKSLDPFNDGKDVEFGDNEPRLEPIERDSMDGQLREGVKRMPNWSDKAKIVTTAQKNIEPVDVASIDPKFNKANELDAKLAEKGSAFVDLNPVQFGIEPETEEGKRKLLHEVQDATVDSQVLASAKNTNTPRLSLDEQDQLARAERLLQNDSVAMKSKKEEIKDLIALMQDSSLDETVQSRATALAQLRVRHQGEQDTAKKAKLDDFLRVAQNRLDSAIQQLDDSDGAQARIAEKKKAFFEEFGIEFDALVK